MVRNVRVSGDPRQNKHVIVAAPVRFVSRSIVEFDALALGDHDATIEAPATVMPPIAGLGTVVLAAPQIANDPVGAAGLAPMLAGPLPQVQPEIALGVIQADNDPEQIWAVPRVGQTPVQRAHEPYRGDEPAPLFARTIEERRAPPPPPKAPPPRPVGDFRGLSAPTSVGQLLGNIAQSYADAAIEAQPRLASAADDRLEQGQARLRACQQRLRVAQTYVQRCAVQVVNMDDYLRAATARGDEFRLLEHYAQHLVRDRAALDRANDDILALTTAMSEIDLEVDQLTAAARVLIEEMS